MRTIDVAPLARGLQVPIGDEESPVQVNVPWQVIAGVGVIVIIVLVVVAVAVLVWVRRLRRRPEWKQRRLQLEELVLPDNARKTLIRHQLRLGRALDTAQHLVTTEHADVGDIRALNARLHDIGSQLSSQIDVLLSSNATPSAPVLAALDQRVSEIETATGTLMDATTIAVTGSTEIELEAMQRDVQDQLDFVDARIDALRELTNPPNPLHEI